MENYLFPQPTKENPHVDPNSPYGFHLRCQRRVWREYKRGYGWRVGIQTSDPRRNNEVWNKPKFGNYHLLVLFYIDPQTGYIEHTALNGYNIKENAEFATELLASGQSLDNESIAILRFFIKAWDVRQAQGEIKVKMTTTVDNGPASETFYSVDPNGNTTVLLDEK